ncbi:FxsA family membrane protein [Streptomyces sp. NBC_00582]|uniref:FxsA family membrane protein n=1 Tax=Streptomyces sp. NBC_00582 TaxID=2975783 RepID=UPI0010630C78|nr:FxsA family membrane protein [Streptomyces sp. NBC_00582]WUB66120.1 FxsA family protein [Streptomyces sp. NBC_00582]
MTTGAPIPTYPVSGPGPGSAPARPRRSRLRTFLPLGLAAWLVLEIWLLSTVAAATSGFVVFLLLVAGFVLGSVVIKRAGRRAFRNLNEALQRGGSPSKGSGNGLMMLGGLLLMIPGLLSDAAGLLLLLPPVQKAVSSYTERKLLAAATPGSLGDAFQQARIHRPDGKVVQGEVVRDEE